MAVSGGPVTALSALGLPGRRSSFTPKLAAAVVAEAIGGALKRVRQAVKQVDPKILAAIQLERLTAREKALQVNMSQVHDAKRDTVVRSQVRMIEKQEAKAMPDPLEEKIRPIVKKVMSEIEEEKETDD